MRIEAFGQRPLAVLRPIVSGQRDETDRAMPCADAPRRLVAVDVGQTDVDEGPVGLGFRDRTDGVLAGGRHADLMALELEEDLEGLAAVLTVLDDEHSRHGATRTGHGRLALSPAPLEAGQDGLDEG